MVFFNYSTMQMAAKVVYYGPGLCGKTTNLQYIFEHTANESRGEMVSLATETDRTLFFDLLPIDVGTIAGFSTRIQLYTVPGQVFYNTTRKLVLKGVDGVVFVADSQRPMLQANIDSFQNLEDNLAEIGLSLDTVPLVLQYNKRDLPGICTVEELEQALNTRKWASAKSSAITGTGVFETLKLISKLTLMALKKRLTRGRPEGPMGPRSQSMALRGDRAASARSAAPKPATKATETPPPNEVKQAKTPPDEANGQSPAKTPPADRPTKETKSPEPAAAPPETVASPSKPTPSFNPEQAEAETPPNRESKPKPVAPRPARPRRSSGLDALAELEKIREQTMRRKPATARVPVPATSGIAKISRELRVGFSPQDLARTQRLVLSLTAEDANHQLLDRAHELIVDIDNADALRQILLHLEIALEGSGKP